MTAIWSKDFGQGDYTVTVHETGDVSINDVALPLAVVIVLDGAAAVELAGLIMKFKEEGLLNNYSNEGTK